MLSTLRTELNMFGKTACLGNSRVWRQLLFIVSLFAMVTLRKHDVDYILRTSPEKTVPGRNLQTVTDFTAPFNNTRTLKFKAQPTNAFFATVNQMFGGSSQLPTTAERGVMNSLCTVQTTKQCSAVVVNWEEPSNIWLTAAKNAFVGRPLNFRVRMLLKSALKKGISFRQKKGNILTAVAVTFLFIRFLCGVN